MTPGWHPPDTHRPHRTDHKGRRPAVPAQIEAIEQIMDAYRAEKIAFPWHEGDVMLVDNMSVAHGRETYSGARRIVVAMTEPYSGEE